MKYSNPQVAYHWLSALLIAVMAGSGMAYRLDLADDGAMLVHQIAGQALILVLALRLVTRLARPLGPSTVQHAAPERALASTVHIALYATLIALVVTGYISASAETRSALIAPVSLAFARTDTGELILEAHFLLKWVLLTLVSLHIAGALKHRFWDKDATLSHMTFSTEKG